MASPSLFAVAPQEVWVTGRQDGPFDFLFDGAELLANEDEVLRVEAAVVQSGETLAAVQTWALTWRAKLALGAETPELYGAQIQLDWGMEQWGNQITFDATAGGVVYVRGSWLRATVSNLAVTAIDPTTASTIELAAIPVARAGVNSPLTYTDRLGTIAPLATAESLIPAWAESFLVRAVDTAEAIARLDIAQLSRRAVDVVIENYPTVSNSFQRLNPDGGVLRFTHTLPVVPVVDVRVRYLLRLGLDVSV